MSELEANNGVASSLGGGGDGSPPADAEGGNGGDDGMQQRVDVLLQQLHESYGYSTNSKPPDQIVPRLYLGNLG